MTVQCVDPGMLKDAYQVFLEETERFGDNPFEAREVLDALSAVLPSVGAEMVIAYFKRCAALSGLICEYEAIQVAYDAQKDRLFAIAAAAPVIEDDVGGGCGNSWFDELEFQGVMK